MLALTGDNSLKSLSVPRGKEYGHDVDFLLTMPEMGKEEGLLLHVIDRLRDQVNECIIAYTVDKAQ